MSPLGGKNAFRLRRQMLYPTELRAHPLVDSLHTLRRKSMELTATNRRYGRKTTSHHLQTIRNIFLPWTADVHGALRRSAHEEKAAILEGGANFCGRRSIH